MKNFAPYAVILIVCFLVLAVISFRFETAITECETRKQELETEIKQYQEVLRYQYLDYLRLKNCVRLMKNPEECISSAFLYPEGN